MRLGYVTKEEVRNLTGLTDRELEDERLDQIIQEAERMVEIYTGKAWTETDSEYSQIQTVTRMLAASLAYEAIPLTEEVHGKAARYHELAVLLLRSMRVASSAPLKTA